MLPHVFGQAHVLFKRLHDGTAAVGRDHFRPGTNHLLKYPKAHGNVDICGPHGCTPVKCSTLHHDIMMWNHTYVRSKHMVTSLLCLKHVLSSKPYARNP